MRTIFPRRDPGTSEFRPLDEEDEHYALDIQLCLQKWHEDHDAVAALDAFVYCYEAGVYPPTWVMDWIGQALTQYLDEGGASSIEGLLGLKPGRGQANPLNKREREGKTSLLAHSAWLWVRVFGITTGEAAYRAVRRCEADNRNAPSPEWLEEQCRRYWFSKFDSDPGGFIERFRSSPEMQQSFIDSHPPDARDE